MCGLMVRASTSAPFDLAGEDAAWQAAMTRLRRRGPDAEGHWTSPDRRVRMSHARLAINDLTDAGAQPMTRATNRAATTTRLLASAPPASDHAAIVFNGEIYNAPTLRRQLAEQGFRCSSRTDTEVVLYGYLHWGLDELLNRLIGMYAFVIYDARSHEIVAAIDHVGMKPLAWAMRDHDSTIILGSDVDIVRTILAGTPREHRAQPSLSRDALAKILVLGYCPAPHSVWTTIHTLAPGAALRWKPGMREPQLFTHWRPPSTCDHDRGGCAESGVGDQRELAHFTDLWTTVVGDHLMSDVPVALFLSGGLDSTAVAVALADLRASDVSCLTLALPGLADESPAAAITAQRLGLRHERIPCQPDNLPTLLRTVAQAFDQPQIFGALLTQSAIANAARQSVKVVLAGDGGDEAFAGYSWHTGAFDSPMAHLRRVMPRFTCDEARRLIPGTNLDHLATWAEALDAPDLPDPRRAQRFDLLTFCAGSILPKIDRASMHVGLEVRSPFLDRRLLDRALTRPPSHDTRHGERQSKPLLRRYLRGRVPDEVLDRPKQGFSLRLSGAGCDDVDPWPAMLPWLAQSRLAREVLDPRWPSIATAPSPLRSQRIHSLVMLASWYEEKSCELP